MFKNILLLNFKKFQIILCLVAIIIYCFLINYTFLTEENFYYGDFNTIKGVKYTFLKQIISNKELFLFNQHFGFSLMNLQISNMGHQDLLFFKFLKINSIENYYYYHILKLFAFHVLLGVGIFIFLKKSLIFETKNLIALISSLILLSSLNIGSSNNVTQIYSFAFFPYFLLFLEKYTKQKNFTNLIFILFFLINAFLGASIEYGFYFIFFGLIYFLLFLKIKINFFDKTLFIHFLITIFIFFIIFGFNYYFLFTNNINNNLSRMSGAFNPVINIKNFIYLFFPSWNGNNIYFFSNLSVIFLLAYADQLKLIFFDKLLLKKFIITLISFLFIFGSTTIIYDIFLKIPFTEKFRNIWKSAFIFNFFLILFFTSFFEKLHENFFDKFNIKKFLFNFFIFFFLLVYYFLQNNNFNISIFYILSLILILYIFRKFQISKNITLITLIFFTTINYLTNIHKFPGVSSIISPKIYFQKTNLETFLEKNSTNYEKFVLVGFNMPLHYLTYLTRSYNISGYFENPYKNSERVFAITKKVQDLNKYGVKFIITREDYKLPDFKLLKIINENNILLSNKLHKMTKLYVYENFNPIKEIFYNDESNKKFKATGNNNIFLIENSSEKNIVISSLIPFDPNFKCINVINPNEKCFVTYDSEMFIKIKLQSNAKIKIYYDDTIFKIFFLLSVFVYLILGLMVLYILLRFVIPQKKIVSD